jgi:cytochrome c553
MAPRRGHRCRPRGAGDPAGRCRRRSGSRATKLGGRPAPYLARDLRAYRDGERRNEVMSIAARPLSDQDIRDLAAYYASIQISVKTSP